MPTTSQGLPVLTATNPPNRFFGQMYTLEKALINCVSQPSQHQLVFRPDNSAKSYLLFAAIVIGACAVGLTGVEPAVTLLLWIFALMPLTGYLYMIVPRSMSLNFDDRTFEETVGFGPFVNKQVGTFDEITSIYVRIRDANTINPSYDVGLTFSDLAHLTDTVFDRSFRPPCLLLAASDKQEVWKYAENLAGRFGTPYQKVPWPAAVSYAGSVFFKFSE